MLSLLELVPATRIGVKLPGGVYKSERHFFDFVVNGRSLWEEVGKPKDMVSVLCFEYAREETIKAANRLLLNENAVIPNDRRSLFICSECGDIGCGAVTALGHPRRSFDCLEEFGMKTTTKKMSCSMTIGNSARTRSISRITNAHFAKLSNRWTR